MKTPALLQPQEIEVFYLIPAIKRQIALALKEEGMKQKRIAELLHIEPATVSQYLHDKRGTAVTLSEDVISEIKHSSAQLKTPLAIVSEIQKILQIIRQTGLLCKIHKELSTVPGDCQPQTMGCHVNTQHGYARIRH